MKFFLIVALLALFIGAWHWALAFVCIYMFFKLVDK